MSGAAARLHQNSLCRASLRKASLRKAILEHKNSSKPKRRNR
jgi:uncharacterized protein YjbI with pentapeptide repeats